MLDPVMVLVKPELTSVLGAAKMLGTSRHIEKFVMRKSETQRLTAREATASAIGQNADSEVP